MIPVHLHWPTVRGRLRADRGLLVLTGLVIALTSTLLAAVGPLTTRTADRAMASAVRDAGPGGDVVATLPPVNYLGIRRRDPRSVQELQQNIDFTRSTMTDGLAAAVQPGLASVTSDPLRLPKAGPGRSIRLVYAQTPDGSPAVKWTAGGAPTASPGAAQADQAALPPGTPPWPVQVGLSEKVAAELGVGPGDRLKARDEVGRAVDVRVSGIYTADDPDDGAWRGTPELLNPSVGETDGMPRIAVAALVSSAALPDLRIAVPSDELSQVVTFEPVPERFHWQQAPALRRAVVKLQAAPVTAAGRIEWGTELDRVLDNALAQISTARGQAQVLLVGLLGSALLTLVLAAHLLVLRRAGSLRLARERGSRLLDIAPELAFESIVVASIGAGLGLAACAVLVGSVGWRPVVPAVVIGVLAAPVLGMAYAARATAARRVPANRAARRATQRTRQVRRVVLEATAVALAALTFVALKQRGVLDSDLTPASAATWWAVVGALVLVRALPLLAHLALRSARRTAGRMRFFITARVAEAGTQALSLLVIVVAVTQLVLGSALAATEKHGQEAGALLEVGADARLTTTPDPTVAATAKRVAARRGVQAAASGRVADGLLASAADTSATVQLVVVDAPAYERLLAASALPDAPQLARLTDKSPGSGVPALLLGGPAGLSDQLHVQWGDDDRVALDVVGEAPRVDTSEDPVVIVDRAAFAAVGADAEPNTVWAVGAASAAALDGAAADDAGASVTTYDDVLAGRRDAPLASALVHLATAATVLLLLLAGLGVVLSAAAEAPARAASLGRLRSLGLPDRELRGVLTGELLTPVVASALSGLVLGAVFAFLSFGSLGLEQITGQAEPPQVVISLWTAAAVCVLVLTALVIAGRETGRLLRTNLARLLRSGQAG